MNREELLDHPEEIIRIATDIYNEKYRVDCERSHMDHFVAVDVTTGEAYIGEFSGDVMDEADKKSPEGVFHIIRIGSEATYEAGYLISVNYAH